MHTKYSELGKCYFYDNGGCCKFVKFIYLVSVESNNSKALFRENFTMSLIIIRLGSYKKKFK